jgi:putative phosphoesterase
VLDDGQGRQRETDLEALNDELVGMVRESVKPAHVSLWLGPDTPVNDKQEDQRDYLSPLALVIADTHLQRRAKALPEGLLPYLERADLILHAGDLMDPTLLDDLAACAPVRAVRGNLDPPEAGLPEAVQFEFGGVSMAMIHDSGPKRGRRNRLRRRFPGARVVVFGHSHIPWLEDEEGFLLLNPGSPTSRRRQPEHTFALLWVEGGEVRAEVLAL